jgi:putative addiction module component (TIGR02574 family)
MSSRVNELVAAVLELPESDQAEAELAAELDRRHAEFLRDPTVAIPWEEVKPKRSAECGGRICSRQ